MKYKIKKWDLIIISGLFVISFLPYIGIKTIIGTQAESTYAYIAISDELYKEIPLTGQMSQKQIEIENEYGKNTIMIENESIAIVESDCPDHLCEEFGFKNTVGDIIVCLPHQLYIEIKGNKSSQSQVDAKVY